MSFIFEYHNSRYSHNISTIVFCNLSESYLFLEDLGLYWISGVGIEQLVARDNWISEFQLDLCGFNWSGFAVQLGFWKLDSVFAIFICNLLVSSVLW